MKVLALAPGHRLPRDRVVELLWGSLGAGGRHREPAQGGALRPPRAGRPRAVVLRQGLVELAPDAEVTTDVERFEAGDAGAYGGELLPDDAYEEWAVAARDRLRGLRVDQLRSEGRWHDVLAEDPADERAHRELLREDLGRGDRLAAARRFRLLGDELARLGLQPSDETRALYGELAAGPAVQAAPTLDGPIVGRQAALALGRQGAAPRPPRAAAPRSSSRARPGIGKTRYVEALLRAARAPGLAHAARRRPRRRGEHPVPARGRGARPAGAGAPRPPGAPGDRLAQPPSPG